MQVSFVLRRATRKCTLPQLARPQSKTAGKSDVELAGSPTIPESVWRRLFAFAIASLCLHAGLLLAFRMPPARISDQVAANLSIDLVPLNSAESEPTPPAVHSPKKRRSKPPASLPAKIARARPVEQKPATPPEREIESIRPAPASEQVRAPDPSAPIAPSPTAKATTEPDRLHAPSAAATIRTLLLTDLARRFDYPPLARRRGWQGMVLLSVTLDPDGTLEFVRVSQSSGYAVLDQSAIETMRRVGYIAEAKPWLNGRGLELLLPIVYRLTD